MSRFNSIIFDVDSTLSGIEGIDWLAAQRGPEIESWSAALTEKAMKGEIPIEAVYSERMRIVKPTLPEIQELGKVYVERIAPGAVKTIARVSRSWHRSRDGQWRFARGDTAAWRGSSEWMKKMSMPSRYSSTRTGRYAGFDDASLLTRQSGKRTIVGQMKLKGPILAVGDGMTDWK